MRSAVAAWLRVVAVTIAVAWHAATYAAPEHHLAPPALVISEVMAANRTTLLDEDGDSPDWIELYNPTAAAVTLRGYALSDSARSPRKWLFPEGLSIAANSYLLLCASGKDRLVADKEPLQLRAHTNFRLNRRQESVLLTDPSGTIVDQLSWREAQVTDRSCGRANPGEPLLYYLVPTPGTANSHLTTATPPPQEVVVLPQSRRFEESLAVEVQDRLRFDGVVYRYALGGASPSGASPALPEVDGKRVYGCTNSTVFRVAGFVGAQQVTQVTDRTYLNEPLVNNVELPLLTLVVAPKDLDHLYANYLSRGKEYEVPTTLEIWDHDFRCQHRQLCGLRFQGGGGRSNERARKISYRLRFDREYGGRSALQHPLFAAISEDFDHLMLRASNLDSFAAFGTMIRDQVVRDLHASIGALSLRGTFRNLVVNGEYRGIYSVIERPTAAYFASHSPNGPAGWDVIKDGLAIDGDRTRWDEFLAFVEKNDFRASKHYEQLQRRLDVGAFTDYVLLNTWAGNWDWPHHNTIVYRPHTAAGKWRFLSWDVEASFPISHVEIDNFGALFVAVDHKTPIPRGAIETPVSKILRALLANADYRDLFIAKYQALFDGVLAEAAAIRAIQARAAEIRPDIDVEVRIPGSKQRVRTWEHAVDRAIDFVKRRLRVFATDVWRRPEFDHPRIYDTSRSTVSPGEWLPIRGGDLQATHQLRMDGALLQAKYVSPGEIRILVPPVDPERAQRAITLHGSDGALLWQLHFSLTVSAQSR
ncbi:MAG: CotH kinase family protein [Planctomycetota bacterium]